MSSAVLFMSWNRPFPGMEDKAFGYLSSDARAFLERQKGRFFDRMEMIALTAHGGDTNGCVLLFGDRAKLDEMRRTDEFEAFSMMMGSMFDRWGVVPGLNWEGIQAVMARRAKKG